MTPRVEPSNLLSRTAMVLWSRSHPDQHFAADELATPRLRLDARAVPRLVLDRARLRLHTRRNRHRRAELPWITQDALRLLDGLLRPTDVGVEFGSGGSTVWFARRCARVYSVEAVPGWHAALIDTLRSQDLTNVDSVLASADELGYRTDAHRSAYVDAHPGLHASSLDWAFVDGEYRDACVLRAVDLLRPGGLLVLDNANAYLPGPGRGPWQVERTVTADWEKATQLVADWRRVWTTNGVWDTVIWIKP